MIARSTKPERDPKPKQDEQILIDTSRMNKGQAQVLEVAESAREQTSASDGFCGQLLLGRYRHDLVNPFPQQFGEDAEIGDEMVRRVCEFLEANLDPEEVDETRTIPEHVVDGLKQIGVFRMKIPLEYGGLGFSQVNYNRVMMAIASYCGSTAVLVSAHQSIGLPQPLKMCGSAAQKAEYLPRLADGEISAFALTEPDVGSDPARMKTTAVLNEEGTHYIINGVKQWTTNGPIADLLVVMANTSTGDAGGRARITAFIVEGDTPGIDTAHRCDFMGLRGIQNGVMTFTDVRVPAENVIWGEGLGLKMALRTLNTGRLTLPAACSGLAKQCLRIMREWGNEREQWGYAIGRHEAGQEKLAEVASLAFAMEAVTWLTSSFADDGRDVRIEAAMAKLFCSEAAWDIVDTTMQFRAGRGYERARSLADRGEKPYPVERMMRDTRINTIIEGTSDIMELFLAREALDPHLKMAGPLLKGGTGAVAKARALVRMTRFYSLWYPARHWRSRISRRPERGAILADHIRYIDRTSSRLAKTLFHAMARHGPKLEKRQVLLGDFMRIGTELFAMSAAISWADSLDRRHAGESSPELLADVFCTAARRRINARFDAAGENRRDRNAVAKRVIEGRYRWMEEGIIASV